MEAINFFVALPNSIVGVIGYLAGNAIFVKIFSDLSKRRSLKLIRNSKKCKIISESDLLKGERRVGNREIVDDIIDESINDIYDYIDKDTSFGEDVYREIKKNVRNNLESVSDKTAFFDTLLQNILGIAGLYNAKSHSISINKKYEYLSNHDFTIGKKIYSFDRLYLKNIIVHELFHAASSYKIGNVVSCGFHQANGSFGVGVNEGCTDYLAREVCPSVGCGYPYEVVVVRLITKLIGKSRMLEFYFKGNLEGLIKELSKYQSRDDVIQFIRDVDTVTMGRRFGSGLIGLKFRADDMLSLSYDRIKVFLYQAYCNKVDKEYDCKFIDYSLYYGGRYMFLLELLDDCEYMGRLDKNGVKRR